MPIFKKFVEKVVRKKDALPFKVPKNINLVIVDVDTGLPASSNAKKVIYESFKQADNFVTSLEKPFNKDRLRLYDSENERKILRFY